MREGSLLIFNIDIVTSNTDTRFIIRDVTSLEKSFTKNKYKFNIYSNIENIIKSKQDIFEIKQNNNPNHLIELFVRVDQKLVNFDFNKYYIKSYKKLDELNNSKIIDYSIEIS